jgi:Transposase, Mutator family
MDESDRSEQLRRHARTSFHADVVSCRNRYQLVVHVSARFARKSAYDAARDEIERSFKKRRRWRGRGLCKAIDEVFPGTRHLRCWVPKTANVLNKVASRLRSTCRQIFERFTARRPARPPRPRSTCSPTNPAKYDKAVTCLTKDRDALLAFFGFTAEHWDQLRTSNPIESASATVRHRTVRTQGSLSATTAKLMVFKRVSAAAKTWRRLKAKISCQKLSKKSDSKTASRSSKCRLTTPPDRLVTQSSA